MNIFLSLGHSILKNGNITSANGVVNEYQYNKELIAYVRDYLVRAGHKVTLCMCPEKQFTSSGQERLYKIPIENEGNYDYAVELHLNAFNGNAKGCEVYYYDNDKGEKCAERVVAKLATVFSNRGAKQNKSLYFLNSTKAPAILIESFFCDNAEDCEKGKDKKKIAKLIAEGIHGGTIAEAPAENTSGTLYRVQVGAYSVKANAEAMLAKLKKAGFDGFITSSK
jgi:N-acetylmuramoyl-L-alanine amidase